MQTHRVIDEAIEDVLFTEEQIKVRVKELAQMIDNYYKGKNLIIVAILKGAFMFAADLVRELETKHKMEFMALSSYGEKGTARAAVRIVMDIRSPIEGEHVLVVEDIIDSGYTLNYLFTIFNCQNPASLKLCTFLRKKECLKVDVPVHFLGFDVPNKWIVGYGLDCKEKWRTLPYVGTLKKRISKLIIYF